MLLTTLSSSFDPPHSIFFYLSYWFRTGRTNFATEGQYLHGYVFLQDLVERAIIELHADSNVKLSDVYIQQMPYPCHQNDRLDRWSSNNRVTIPIGSRQMFPVRLPGKILCCIALERCLVQNLPILLVIYVIQCGRCYAEIFPVCDKLPHLETE